MCEPPRRGGRTTGVAPSGCVWWHQLFANAARAPASCADVYVVAGRAGNAIEPGWNGPGPPIRGARRECAARGWPCGVHARASTRARRPALAGLTAHRVSLTGRPFGRIQASAEEALGRAGARAKVAVAKTCRNPLFGLFSCRYPRRLPNRVPIVRLAEVANGNRGGRITQQTQASRRFRGRSCVATEVDSAGRLDLRSARAAVTLRSLLACAHLALPRGRGSGQ